MCQWGEVHSGTTGLTRCHVGSEVLWLAQEWWCDRELQRVGLHDLEVSERYSKAVETYWWPRGDVGEPGVLCGVRWGCVIGGGACEMGSWGMLWPGEVAAESWPAPHGNEGAAVAHDAMTRQTRWRCTPWRRDGHL